MAVGLDAPSLSLARWIAGATEVRPAVVGVVNVTPDSFSDGGRFSSREASIAHVDRLIEEGADVIEVGGESTRPAGVTYGDGYLPIDAKTQLERVMPSLAHAVSRGARVAIDTTLPEVAERAIEAGVRIVNDVSCLADPMLARVVASAKDVDFVLMHARPGAASHYDDLFADIEAELRRAIERSVREGVASSQIVIDPGIGFGKGPTDNLKVLAGLRRFLGLGHPLYVGPSRKSFIATCEGRAGLTASAPAERVGGTIAACLWAARQGAAAVRVHDVRAMRQALAVDAAIASAAEGAEADRPLNSASPNAATRREGAR